MEIVDIVDENNKVLYQVPKDEAHKKGLLHRTVIAEFIDGEGRWILVIPRSHKQDAGQYVSPVGGHVSAGESEIEALKRETFEEIGIRNFKHKLIGKKIFNRFVLGRQENHFFVLFEIFSKEALKLGDESNRFDYFTVEEIKSGLKKSPKKFGDAFHFVARNFYPDLYI